MGWTVMYNKPQGTTREILQREFWPDHSYEIIDSAVKGSVFYGAVRRNDTGEVQAIVVLLRRADGGFGYKEMSESSHPYYYDCPGRILDLLTPTEHEGTIEWRAKCREQVAEQEARKQRAATIKVGDQVRLTNPERFQGIDPDAVYTVERYGRNGRKYTRPLGHSYRFPRSAEFEVVS